MLGRATWDEAMDLIVKKSKELVKHLTAQWTTVSGRLLCTGTHWQTCPANTSDACFDCNRSPNLVSQTDTCTGLERHCTATAPASMTESYGSDGQPGSYTDIDCTDCLFMVVHNMAATQTVLWAAFSIGMSRPILGICSNSCKMVPFAWFGLVEQILWSVYQICR